MSLTNSDVLLSNLKYTYTFKWEIPNFSTITLGRGHKLRSSTFISNYESSEIQWELWLYPEGAFEKPFLSKEFVALYLCLLNPSTVAVKYSFFILDSNNQKLHVWNPAELTSFSKQNCAQKGTLEFVERSILLGNKNGLLNKDKLTIVCEIEVSNVKDNPANRRIEILDKFEKLVNDAKFSDVIFLIVNDDKVIHAHKNILANQNAVFAAMFEHDMKENKGNVIEIVDIEYEVLKEMLLYLYTGKVNEIEKHCKKLLFAADKYAIDGLKSMCERFLCSSISGDNFVELLHLSDMYHAEKLQEEAIKYVVSHSGQLSNTFDLMEDLRKEILIKVVKAFAQNKKT